MFSWGEFVSASGVELPYKIDCDQLKQKDLQCVVSTLLPLLEPFGKCVSVSTGGLKLAKIFNKHSTPDSSMLLVVDSVWVSGQSMRDVVESELRDTRWTDWQGAVIFARGRPHFRVRYFAMVVS